jgi:phenylacetate-CoA ligase
VTADVLDPCESWSRDRIADHQLERLREQLRHVASSSDHYRAQWGEIGFEPEGVRTLEDLAALPVTRKADVQASIEADPPYGEILSVPRDQVARVHFSSGTTAAPTPIAWTAADLERWAGLYARMAWSQGVRPGDVYQCLFGFAWFVGGLGATAGYAGLGAGVIPGGSGDTERQVETIFRFGTTVVGGTPSFVLHLAEAAARAGTPLAGSRVHTVMVGGEPGGAIEGTRSLVEDRWGARCYDGYGCLEFQPIAWECTAQAGGHLAEDFALAEVVDPTSGEPVPDGSPGVLVLTHLDKEACPLVRWWTGDVVVRESTPCDCGRTHARFPGGVRGRADDMLVIRGVNLFPSALEDVLRRQPGVGHEFRIVLDQEEAGAATGYRNGFTLEVEAAADAPADLDARVAEVVHRTLNVRPTVQVLVAGRLPRSTRKSRRVVVAGGA